MGMPVTRRTRLGLSALLASACLVGACAGSDSPAPPAPPPLPVKVAAPAAPPAPAAQPAPSEPAAQPAATDPTESCATRIARAAFAVIRANQACTKDADCAHVNVGCVECGGYVNASAVAAVEQAAREAVPEPCKCPRSKARCPAPAPACVDRRCMYRKK
jgi:hypothetical protein